MSNGTILEYNRALKKYSRELRSNMTRAESKLWFHIRKGQILGVQFYRQKPILNYIADFYAHQPKLAIECDGAQHFDEEHIQNDKARDQNLSELGIKVLRFDNGQIIHEMDHVLQTIWDAVENRLVTKPKYPRSP